MGLSEITSDLKAHFEAAEADAKRFLTEHLPALSELADKAAANPLVDAALSAAHLSPEMLTALAAVITKADAEIAAFQPPEPVPSGPDAEPDPA